MVRPFNGIGGKKGLQAHAYKTNYGDGHRHTANFSKNRSDIYTF